MKRGVIIFYRYYPSNPTSPPYLIKNERSLKCKKIVLVDFLYQAKVTVHVKYYDKAYQAETISIFSEFTLS